MRVTMSMIFNNATRNIQTNTQNYYRLQEQLFSQKRINRPSDDPVSTTRILDLRKLGADFEQFDRNIDTAEGFISQTDVALTQVSDRLQRAIELTVDINDTNSGPSEYAAAAAEMGDIFQSVLGSANDKIGNRYIFGGFRTTTAPFNAVGAYSGGPAGQNINVEVAQGEYMTINLTGDSVFKGPVDVMQVIQDAQTAIASGNQTAISAILGPLNDALDQILTAVTANGAKQNRVDIARSDNEELADSFKAILSNTEDLDVTEASSQFAVAQQVLQANQLMSAKIIQQNFLDYFS